MSSDGKMVVCDLDGTLLQRGKPIHPEEIRAFQELGTKGVVRVIATGRALHSCRKVIPADFPIDYLVFSSGAGIVDWKRQELLVFHNLTASQTRTAIDVYLQNHLDFMIHEPLPEAQPFFVHRTGKENQDFEARLNLHSAHGKPFQKDGILEVASQLLAICPEGDPFHPFEAVRDALPGMTVVRATSPLDGKSIWLEVFSENASKSKGSHWIAQRYGVSPKSVLAVGNDYNDLDLLNWAGAPIVMDNSPAILLGSFPSVPCADAQGVSRAIRSWLS